MTRAFKFGPRIEGEFVRFRLWAPSKTGIVVELASGERAPLEYRPGGWAEARLRCPVGAHYRFRIGDTTFPDPASRRQSGGPHGWSVVCAPGAATCWRGRPWQDAVIYELHAGLLGGFGKVTDALAGLAALGITAIELMPIAAFPGSRNWGYDGVLPFAPAEAYGSPEDLRALIARAHSLELMIFLDVVYNHFGPDGNYLAVYANRFFRDDIATPWGSAIDFREPEVREFFTENALYWVCEFGFDGLRFDAVHAIRDEGWLHQLATELREHAPEREIHLILENDANDAKLLRHGFTAQWNDDLHHALHVLLTGETRGYYEDYRREPAEHLARALAEGFVYQGEPSAYRGGTPRGTPSADLGPASFVSFLQNHDQTGNRPLGERLLRLASPEALRAAIALLLLSPQIPLIFMGEETGSEAPFLYFTDHEPALAEAVRQGRRREFSALYHSTVGDLPDPNAQATYARSFPLEHASESGSWREFYQRLLSVRRERIVPYLNVTKAIDARAISDKAVLAQWRLGKNARLVIACNLGSGPVEADLPSQSPIWGPNLASVLPPHTTVTWFVDA